MRGVIIGVPVGAALWALIFWSVSRAFAGLDVPPAPATAPDLSAYPTKAEMQSTLSAMQAAIPQPDTAVPPTETIGGAPGSANTFRRGDARAPRITRSKTVTLAADGTATFDWTAQGALATPVQVATTAVYTGTGVPKCWATATSATAVSIKCVVENNTLISLAALTAGLNLNGMSAAGLSVGVIVLPAS